jgi:hypothetical protein
MLCIAYPLRALLFATANLAISKFDCPLSLVVTLRHLKLLPSFLSSLFSKTKPASVALKKKMIVSFSLE